MTRPLRLMMLRPARLADPRVLEFDALYERHFDFVYRCLRRLGVAERHAEEAAQDAFMVLHRRLGDLWPGASERGFLFGIASHVARTYRRKQARSDWAPLADISREDDARSPYDHVAHAEAARRLDVFLATLEDEQRAVFVLMELEELSAPEVVEALGVKLNTVYSRLRLARERLTRFLQTEGVVP